MQKYLKLSSDFGIQCYNGFNLCFTSSTFRSNPSFFSIGTIVHISLTFSSAESESKRYNLQRRNQESTGCWSMEVQMVNQSNYRSSDV